MTAVEVLRRASETGLTVFVRGIDRIVVRGRTDAIEVLKPELSAHKPEIVRSPPGARRYDSDRCRAHGAAPPASRALARDGSRRLRVLYRAPGCRPRLQALHLKLARAYDSGYGWRALMMRAAKSATTEIVTMAVKDLKPAPYNPRRIDNASLAALGKSIDRFGVVEPIIFNRRSGFVVGGHQRLKVLRSKKIASTPVVVVDLDETEERALNVALNSSKLTGEFTGALHDLLAEIEAADQQIFHELRLNELLGDQEPQVYLRDPDEAPAVATRHLRRLAIFRAW